MSKSLLSNASISALLIAGMLIGSAQSSAQEAQPLETPPLSNAQSKELTEQGKAILDDIAAKKEQALAEAQATEINNTPDITPEITAEKKPSAATVTPVGAAASASEASVRNTSTSVASDDVTQESDFAKFSVYPEVSTITVNYEDYIRLMNSYTLVHKNRVKFDFVNLKTTGARALISYLQYLKELPVDQLSRNDQLAYWLNMHNLLVVFSITVDSSADLAIERGTFDNPGELWTKKLLVVNGVNMSIDDIEKKIILTNWNDPNIVYGLYQGVVGTPPMYKPGFRGHNVRDVLPKLGKRYLNEKNTLSIKSNTINVPQVYEWFEADLFKGDDAQVIKHIRRLSREKQLSKLEPVNKVAFADLDYGIDTIGKLKINKARKAQRKPIQAPSPGGGGSSGS